MRLRQGNAPALAMEYRVAHRQLAFQMRPLVEQLAFRLGDSSPKFFPADLPMIKFISAPGRFLMNHGQIAGQGCGRISRRLEPGQLRMMPIAPRASLQNFLRQQSLPPQRHQAFGVKVFWVNRPETHDPMVMPREAE